MEDASVALDHLLLGVADLDHGMKWVRERLGVEPVIGGSHPGKGTRNALLSLGGRHYLEIIAPDPAQKTYNFYVDVRQLAEPKLVTWAARTPDIGAAAQRAREAGYRTDGPLAGSRVTPAGQTLRWKTLAVAHDLVAAPVNPIPFFIEWAPESAHPSSTAPGGCRLESMAFAHPRAAEVRAMLANLGIQAEVESAAAAGIRATLRAGKGLVQLG